MISTNFFREKYTRFFYKQPSYYKQQGFNVKNGLKVKELAKQPPTLKALMQKILVGLWVKKFTFFILSSLKLNLSTTFFGTTQWYLGQILVT